MRNLVLSLFVAFPLLVGCGGESEPEPATTDSETEAPADSRMEASAPAEPLPDRIVAERGGIVPEGIEYDPRSGRLLSGSLNEGSIFHWHPDGTLEAVVTDPDLVSSVGIEVDTAGSRLLVANSDRGAFEGETQGQAMLGAYDLADGERLAMIDLAALDSEASADATFFANDVAVADDGAAYVTETLQNVIYRVGADYEPSVFYRFPPTEGLGLNGIVHHPSGYLLVAGGETLYRVPISDPSQRTPVTLPETIAGQDGMVLTSDGRLLVVSNSQNRVVALESDDDWASARISGVAPFEAQGTTAAIVEGDVYVVHPHFADEEPPSVERVTFR